MTFTADDFTTSKIETCKGFVEQAAVKSRRASKHLDAAKVFWDELQKVKSLQDLTKSAHLKEELISVAGVSAKARKYLTSADIETILSGIVAGIPADASTSFHQDIFMRYLLTKGASFDGEMRNVVGATAQRKVAKLLISKLSASNLRANIVFSGTKKGVDIAGATKAMEDESAKISLMEWKNRVLLFDKKPKIINKSVDAILLDSSSGKGSKELQELPTCYLACGELKGGIDPAGADEHWKTAVSALDRIRTVFAGNKKPPLIFFIGAAIEQSMASELASQLNKGALSMAANLTKPQQLDDLVSSLLRL
jgi:hypothetical protein